MSVLMLLEWKQTPIEAYERVNEVLGIESEADAPDGLVDHVACAVGDGLLICDVWESEEAMGRFMRERLAGAVDQVGIASPSQPRILAVHDRLPGTGTDARVLLLIELPGLSPERYDDLAGRMDAHVRGDHPAVAHTAAIDEHGGIVVVDLWDSPASFEAFAREQIAPAAAQVGLGDFEPRVLPIRNRLRGRAAQRTTT